MQTVKVRLRKPTRVFNFLCDDIDLKRDDRCIVESERGLEYGACLLPPKPCPSGAEQSHSRKVLRKTTNADEAAFTEVIEHEKAAWAFCREQIKTRKLKMKLVDVEYTFDRHKAIFYFSAEDRVDFRDLVRDLAKGLKARIELRQIQVRDEAKLVGGIGVCGRELCCSTWMREFKPISMKMAKRQNLSLNPSKISGQCGRLLCCLSYENELYQNKKSVVLAEHEAAEAKRKADGEDSSDLGAEDPFPEAEIFTAYAGGKPPTIEELDEDEGETRPSAVLDLESDGDDSGGKSKPPGKQRNAEPARQEEPSPKPKNRSRSRRKRKRSRGSKDNDKPNSSSSRKKK